MLYDFILYSFILDVLTESELDSVFIEKPHTWTVKNMRTQFQIQQQIERKIFL